MHRWVRAITPAAGTLSMFDYANRWTKFLRASAKPAYLAIADAIGHDIKSGRLSASDRLPPLRTLAEDLGLNYTTVARGYAEARRRGLIEANVGRGSFIRPAGATRSSRTAWFEMTMNFPPEPQDPALLRRLRDGFDWLKSHADPHALLRYDEFGGTPEDRDAGARWLHPLLPGATAEQVLVCPGIQSTLAVLMASLAGPGEVVCAEAITYPGVKAIAAQLGVRLHALAMDEQGIDPHAFEHACKELKPKALYCNPTLQNPTTLTISAERRAALADLALRYSVPIIEDDPYGILPGTPTPPLATLAPELTYYISGLAKCLGAGLRVAYLCVPDARGGKRIAAALRALTVMASPITNTLATHWINDGTAAAMLLAIRKESAERQKLAAVSLAGQQIRTHREAFHIWLALPKPWNRIEFASHLSARGVGVVGSHAFCVDNTNPPEAVRICLGGPANRVECRNALELIQNTLAQQPALAAVAM